MNAHRNMGLLPTNDEAPTVAGSKLQGTNGNESHEYAQGEAQLQAFARLRAQLALPNYTLLLGSKGEIYVKKWGFVKNLDGLAGVESFARQVGAT